MAVVRDAFAHGTRVVDGLASARLAQVGAAGRAPEIRCKPRLFPVANLRRGLRSLPRCSGFNAE